MIIDRFGDIHDTAFQLPSLQAEDDWQSARPAVTARVGGASGVYDFHGSEPSPLDALTVRKTFNLTGASVPFTGSGRIALTLGDATVTGMATHFLTEAEVGGRLSTGFGVHLQSGEIASITDDEHMEMTAPAFEDTTDAAYTLTRLVTWSSIDLVLDELKRRLLSAGESKLWSLLRHGGYRWAWAKCTVVEAPEKYQNKSAIPCTIEFSLREGLWYGATQQSLTISNEASPYTFTLVNNGHEPALVAATLTNAAADALELVKLENLTNGLEWTFDEVLEDGELLVDAAGQHVAYSDPATPSGYQPYAHLILGANQIVFMQLEPGVNSMRFSATITGTPDYDLLLTWYDTYL